MYKPIEYYTELIQKFEEWIKYLKNGGNPNLVERLLEREGIYSADYIDYKLAYNPVIMGLSVTTDEDTEITFRRKTIDKYCELIDTIKEYKEEAQREQEKQKIQEEAQNDKEIEFIKPYLNKLIDSPSYRGWCKLKDGIYIWDKCRGGKTNLAIFLIVIYREIKHTNIPAKFLGGYFGIKNISQIVNQIDSEDKRVNDLKGYLKKD